MRSKPRTAAAIVVTFHPKTSIVRNIRALAEQLYMVYVVDNSPGHRSQRIFHELTRFPQVRLIRLRVNIGIGGALNIGMQLAKADGFLWAFTFDQDSILARGAAKQMQRAARQDNIALVAPLVRDARSHSPMLRKEDEWLPHNRQVVITSGNLVRIAAWESIGGFDWQLFLDGVDFDFCLRLAKQGWLIQRSAGAHLRHHLGRPRSVRLFNLVPWTVRNYPPFRRYFQARNAVTVIRRHAGFASMWSLEHLFRIAMLWLKIMIIERNSHRAWTAGLKAGLCKHEYEISAIQPFPPLTRPAILGPWKNSPHHVARAYKKRLEELSTFPSV